MGCVPTTDVDIFFLLFSIGGGFYLFVEENAPKKTRVWYSLRDTRSAISVKSSTMIGHWLIILAVALQSAHSITKTWKSERSRSSWAPNGPDAGCARHTLVYQASGSLENRIPTAQSSIERIVLPEYGAVLIPDANPIVLDYDPHSTCSNGWQSYMQQAAKASHSWYSPDMWTIEGHKFNAAKPHIDRVPCECDTASISSDDTLSIEVDEMGEVVVDDVRVNGQTGSLQQLMGTQLGGMLLRGPSTSAFRTQCKPFAVHCGCHSPRRVVAVTQAVCAHVVCPIADCESPVRPIGHCCDVCGATLQLLLTSCRDVPDLNVEAQLKGALLQNKPERKLLSLVQMYENFYANPDTSNVLKRYIFQMVIVDKGFAYEEYSTQMADVVKQYFRKHFQVNK